MACLKTNVPAHLIFALIKVESDFIPHAYSKDGAVGLMQVMPNDGLAANFHNQQGQPLFADRPSTKRLMKPQFNIYYGSNMLSKLHRQHGNWRDALYAYGPTGVGYSYADTVLQTYNQYKNNR